MSAGFFRKEALEKLSTPEKLDQLINVTSPRSWIALLTIAIILITGIGWSFVGHVKTRLNAVGVLLGGEIHEAVSTSQGQLLSLNVKVGDQIASGDIIATVEQPELQQQLEELRASLEERKFELQELLSFGNQDTKIQQELIEQQRVSIQSQMQSNHKNLDFLKSQLETERDLFAKGLVTKTQVANTEQQIESVKNSLEQLKSQLVQVNSQKLNIDFEMQQRITLNKQRIAETKRQLEHLEERFDIQTNIRSAYDGEVLELLTDAGIIVNNGTPLFKLKNSDTNDRLHGVLYIPAQDGKKIKKGMQALVAPSTVQPQEYGFMKSTVTYVSEFPVTQNGMMMTVKNMQLVQGLLSQGALFEVYVEFEKDPTSYSGFSWTSANGPEILINEGTSCLGKITVKNEAPVAMVVPAFKKFFDLY